MILRKSRSKKVTLQRAFSKFGVCSRTQAETFIHEGRVLLNGRLETNPEAWIDIHSDKITLDGQAVRPNQKIYLALNKPRGLVTTRHDPEGRQTVFDCLAENGLPFLSPVGRLDKASEGLLLFTNDTALAQRLLDPALGIGKTYHVQVSGKPTSRQLSGFTSGIISDGTRLTAARASCVREGERNAWLEVELTEGKNRQIRRMVESLGLECLRLIRVAIHDIELGDLPKGSFRHLERPEVQRLLKIVDLA